MNEEISRQAEICAGKYFPWSAFNKVLWAFAILMVGLIGSATGYAIATSTALGKAEQRIETAQQELETMRATYAQIDAKLDLLLKK